MSRAQTSQVSDADPVGTLDEADILPDGAVVVTTEQLELAHVLLTKVVNSRFPEIVQVVGPPGSGKTTAVDEWCVRHPEIEVARIALGDAAKGYEVVRELLEVLGCPTHGNGRELRTRAVEALHGRKLLIYIDEADMMNRAALRQFRYLYDYRVVIKDPKTGQRKRVRALRFGLALVGSDFSDAWRLAPDLRSRCDLHARFGRIPIGDLKRVLGDYHPIFAQTPVKLLRTIDAETCHGMWRAWQRLLRQVLDRAPDAILITEEMAERILGVSGAAA